MPLAQSGTLVGTMRKKERQFAESQAWLDWLSDDPVDGVHKADAPASSKRSSDIRYQSAPNTRSSSKLSSPTAVRFKSQNIGTQRVTHSAPPAVRAESRRVDAPAVSPTDNRVIDINITLPKITAPKLPHIAIPWTKVVRWGGILVLLVIVVFAAPHILQLKTKQAQKQTATATKPAYAPLEPSSGEGNVSGAQYDSKRQLYKYNDVYMEANLTVSQQPLPDTLREGKIKLKDIAQASIGETEKFDTIHGSVYIATDSTTGIQRMVIAHRQLLIFIQSSKALSNADWVTYIQTLQ